MTLKNDIERYVFEELPLKRLLVDTIKPKQRPKFIEPFRYEEESLNANANEIILKPESFMKEEQMAFKCNLESKHFKDSEGGDCGGL